MVLDIKSVFFSVGTRERDWEGTSAYLSAHTRYPSECFYGATERHTALQLSLPSVKKSIEKDEGLAGGVETERGSEGNKMVREEVIAEVMRTPFPDGEYKEVGHFG